MTSAQVARSLALKAKLNEKLKMTDEQQCLAGPPSNRVSAFGPVYLGSTDAQWMFAPGVGWYHKSEHSFLERRYIKSKISGRYYQEGDMVQFADGSGHVSRTECADPANELAICAHSGRVGKLSELRETHDHISGAVKMVLLKYWKDPGHFLTCEFTKWKFPIGAVLKIHTPLNYAYVSEYAIKQNPKVFKECPRCGNVKEAADILPRPDLGRDEVCCTHCYNAAIASSLIREHNYDEYPAAITKPRTVKRVKKKVVVDEPDDYFRMFGVECEMEIDTTAKLKGLDRFAMAKQVYSAMGRDFVVIKRDGSLDMNAGQESLLGFEVVSAPADIETHRERWKALETMPDFNLLRAWDTITCGMHVHVSRDVLTTLQIGRMIVFINHPNNKKFIATVAGRSCGPKGYNRVCEKKLGDGVRADPDKYVAVNTKHKHTIEFRIFRGTVRYRHIIRNIEFVDAVCAFCHPASRSLNDMASHERFCEFMAENRKQYPLLTEWMAAKGMIKPKRPKPGTKPEPVVEFDLVETGEKQAR